MIKLDLSKKILFVEIIGILIVIFFLWIDEILDIPHFIFGGSATPINFFESLFETLVILLLGTLIVLISIYLLKKIRSLEGLLHMCIFCKKIRIDGDWLNIEFFLSEHSEAEFSHGLCPDCIEKYYGEFLGPKKLKKILNDVSQDQETEII